MIGRRIFLQGMGAAAVAAGLPWQAQAQPAYPERVVRLIVPRPSGGVVDVIAREWSDKVGKSFGATYVDNIGGGGGTIGAATVARAPADGYTLLLGTTSELVISPILAHQSYDPVESFEPIAMICASTASIVVHPSVPASNLKELVAYAKANASKANYGSAGVNTVSNLAGELFKRVAGVPELTHIPYKGGGPAMSDLIGGQIPIATPMMSESILELHKQGKIKVLAVAARQRLAGLADFATAAEQGFPDLVAQLWFGLFAPAKTPQPYLVKIADATKTALQDAGLKKSFAAGGFEPLSETDPASASAYVKKEIARWTPLLEQFATKRK